MSGEERRAHERESVTIEARLRLACGKELPARIENIGEFGAYVSTAELDGSIEVGDIVQLFHDSADGAESGEAERSGEVLRHDQEFTGGEIRRAVAIRFET